MTNDLKNLKCPECGQEVFTVQESADYDVVIFKCFFSATFDKGVNAETAQKQLDDFKSNGRMEEWLKRGLF